MATNGSSARTIVPLMAFTTGVALVGHTLEPRKSTRLSPTVGDAQILLGGTLATVILTLLSTAGEIGSRFAVGLSAVALVSVLGIYGTGVLSAVDHVTGQTTKPAPTKPAPTKETTPT
jgi:hypothetical protein